MFILTGVERVNIVPGINASNPLDLAYMPFTRSIVASHWLLDLPMHVEDLPLAGGDGAKVGFGLWENRPLSVLLEFGLLAGSIALYFRSSAMTLGPGARKQMAVFSGFVCAYTFLVYFGLTPTGVAMVSGFGLATYPGFA